MRKILATSFFITGLFLNTAAQQAADSLSDYTGQYSFPDGSVVPNVDVTLDNGSLSMHSVAGSSMLAKMGIDSFNIVEFSGLAVFKRGEDKKVNAVYIEAMGYILEGKKKESGAWSYSGWIRKDPVGLFFQ